MADFAKLVELFDAQSVSFVSVTQSFNTTSSMGRLTLNVLLSFAQFEREVIGERVRDKIAASKRKGIWVGGSIPLGYACVDKKVVIVPEEADLVRLIFKRYLAVGSIGALAEDLNRKGLQDEAQHSLDRAGSRRDPILDRGSRLSPPQPFLHRRSGLSRRDSPRRLRADPRSQALRSRADKPSRQSRGAAGAAEIVTRDPDRPHLRRPRQSNDADP